MSNIFKNMQLSTISLDFIEWLINNEFKSANTFIIKCFELYSLKEELTYIKARYINNNELHVIVNKNLFIIKTRLDSQLKLIEMDVPISNYYDEYIEKYDIESYYFVFLESGFVGNLLKIRDNSPFKIIYRKELFDILEYDKISNDINNDYLLRIDELNNRDIKYKEVPYDKWTWKEYKSFFKNIQFSINSGEIKIYKNVQYGDLLYMDFFEVKFENVLIYARLKHDSNQITIRACFDSQKSKKTKRDMIKNKIIEILSSNGCEFSNVKPGQGNCISFVKLKKEYIVLDGDKIDLHKTILNLEEIRMYLNETHS